VRIFAITRLSAAPISLLVNRSTRKPWAVSHASRRASWSGPDRDLSPKFQVGEPAVAQQLPEELLD
jgi:hypothetical protein